MLPNDLSKLAGVQYCQEYIKAQQVRDAAPALLEAIQNLSAAYELLCHATDENPESNAHYRAAIAAIAATKGEV
jgi:hypothetical protein